MAERNLDLFKLLDQISRKNIDYYKTLPDEAKKEFIPFVITRWLSGTSNTRQVYFLNAVVNWFTFELGQDHKQLLYYLMTACTSGKSQRYFWNKLPAKGNSSKPLSCKVIAEYFNYSLRDANQALTLLTKDDVLWYATELGRQAEDITKIKRELKGEE